MSRRRSAWLVLAVLPALAACQLRPRFDLGYDVPQASRAPVSSASLLVLPFQDERCPRRYSTQGRTFLTYIPLLPYVTIPFNRVDEIVIENSERGGGAFSLVSPVVQRIERPEDAHFTVSFPAAIAQDLRASRLFARVEFAKERPADADFDYLLTGTLVHSEYRTALTSYCLGIAGVLLWLLPIPMCKVTGEVELDLVLQDAATGQTVWQKRVSGSETSYRTMYGTSSMIHGTGVGAFTFQVQKGSNDDYVNPYSLFWWSFMALRDAMEQAKPDLEVFLTSQPRSG